jgi:hypothetical protein
MLLESFVCLPFQMSFPMNVRCLLLDHQYLLCPFKLLELFLFDTQAHGSDPFTKEPVLGEDSIPLGDLSSGKFEAAVVHHQALESLPKHPPVVPLVH